VRNRAPDRSGRVGARLAKCGVPCYDTLDEESTTTAKIDGKLDAPEADELFRTITSWGDPNASRRCVIDLTDLEFMLPAGLTAVVQCAAHLKDRGWSPTVRFPARDDVGAYLARMGFRRALRGVARSIGGPRSNLRFRTSTALVELTTVRDTGDVDGLIEGLSDRVAGILEAELGYSGADVGNFCNVLSELSRNIIDHSQSAGYVAAQRYTRSKDNERFALISVGDAGVGLRATLGQRYPVAKWSDADVLLRALMPEYSRHPNRGLGLAFVQKVCQDYRGSLHIRTGGCRLYIRGRKVFRVDAAWFTGTQVAISLQQKEAACDP
jgi:anti-anti-sigma factor